MIYGRLFEVYNFLMEKDVIAIVLLWLVASAIYIVAAATISGFILLLVFLSSLF